MDKPGGQVFVSLILETLNHSCYNRGWKFKKK